jgi:hypothetical protein
MNEEEKALWHTPDDYKGTIYKNQVKVNCSNNTKTVTSHIVLTRGRWWVVGMGFVDFCMQCKDVPAGLPITDETTPIGSPFK